MNNSQSNSKVLILDDKPQNLFALEKLLSKLEVEVVQTTSGVEALGLTLEHEFCLAIVDVQMPEMNGYEFLELLRGNPSTASLPVIFISAIYSDEYHHRKGYDAGAVDFQSLPCEAEGGRQLLFEVVAEKVSRWNTGGNLGLVVGATYPAELRAIRQQFPEMPLLIPGVGAQGGELSQVVSYGVDAGQQRTIINSSRQILYASGGKDFAQAARRAAQELRDQINHCLSHPA